MKTSPTAARAAVAICLSVLVSAGCSTANNAPQRCAETPLPPAPSALIIAVGVHANAPAPGIPETVAPLLMSALAAGAPVKVLAIDGTPAPVPVTGNVTISTATCDGFKTSLKQATNRVIHAVATASADSDGNNLYMALDAASRMARANHWDNAHLVVLDSGLTDRPPLDFSQPGTLAATPDELANFAQAEQGLDLTGLNVDFQGLGATAPPQAPLNTKELNQVAQIWTAIAAQAKASSVTASPTARPTVGPKTDYRTALTPVDPGPSWSPPAGEAPRTISLGSNSVTFAHGSAELADPPTVRKTLDPMIRWLAERPGNHLTLLGRTDSSGTAPYNKRLSKRRAETLKILILSSNRIIDPAQITAEGQGEQFEGFIPDVLPDGTRDPIASAINRHVLVIATQG